MRQPTAYRAALQAALLMCLLALSACAGVKGTTPDAANPVGEAAGGDAPGKPPANDAAEADGEGAGDAPLGYDANEEIELSPEAGMALNDAIRKMQSGDLEGARRKLEGLTSDADAGHLANYNLGVLSVRQGQEGAAENFFQEALRLNPDFTPALVSLTRLYLRQGKPGVAIQVAERFVRERPENLDHVSARLHVMVQLGRYEDVIRDAKEVLRKDERNVQAMISLASAWRELGKHELAESVLLQVVDVVGEDPFVLSDVYYRLGFVYLSLKDDLRARRSFEQAVELRPDFVEARNNLGVMYHRARDYSAAIEQFEASVELYPGYKEAYLNLGNAHKGKRSYVEAEEAFKRAVRVDNRYAAAYFNLGILYLDGAFEGRDRKEQYQQAIDNFNRYKSELGAEAPREDPTDQYIGEALKKIELEKQREEQARNAAMEPEGGEEEFPEEGGEEESPEEGGEEFPEEGGGEESPGEGGEE
jgi:tetratricopeptide (TPR) repeat protein